MRMNVNDVIAELGGPTKAARLLGQKRTAVAMWRARGQVPAEHVLKVARLLDVPPERIRPDLARLPPREAAAA